MQPLVLTLSVDDAAQAAFDRLRRAHFPPGRNHLAAHVTLFHALPGAAEDEVAARLSDAARRPPFPVRVQGLRFLGRGVAHPERARALLAQLSADPVPYDVTATGLALWRYLGGRWEPVGRWPFLGAQGVDRA